MPRFFIRNKLKSGKVIFLVLALLATASCEKYVDKPGDDDPRLARKYCNDPEAVNFNRGFPGTADNSVCYYPADAYKGRYLWIDSMYSNNSLLGQRSLTLDFSVIDKEQMAVQGLCEASGTTVTFTANRQLRAVADTTIIKGQPFCRPKDTVSGYIQQSLSDSTRLRFYLSVVSDTGTVLHQGTAYRQ